jgi:enoyl-CoA hydratase
VSLVLSEQRGSILHLTLNRPTKCNALSGEVLSLLRQELEVFVTQPALRVLLITAKGEYFCAGADLSEAVNIRGPSSAVRTEYRRGLHGMLSLYQEMEEAEKPIVVAHQGPCVGGGLELSLSCDFRLAAARATYSFPEGNFGSLPATGGVSRLTRLVGAQWARWLIMANKPIDAASALSIGLVQAVYPDDTFDASVFEFCEHLARQPPEFLAMAKLAIDLASDLESAQARRLERLANSTLAVGDEYRNLFNQWATRFRKPPGGGGPPLG